MPTCVGTRLQEALDDPAEMSELFGGHLPRPRSAVGAVAGGLGALGSVYFAVSERNPAWVMNAAICAALCLEFPPPERPADAYRLGWSPHLPCTNPTCSTPRHLPPVCDFCYAQPMSWEYNRKGTWWRMIVGFLSAILAMSVLGAASPTLMGLLLGLAMVVVVVRPECLMPPRGLRATTLGSGGLFWSACEDCHQLIQVGDRQAIERRSAALVPIHLGHPDGPLPDSVTARTEAFFRAEPRPRCRYVE